MKLSTSSLFVFSAFVGAAAASKGNCYYGTLPSPDFKIDDVLMESCHHDVAKSGKWFRDTGDDGFCGGRKWFSGAVGWDSAAKCYAACAPCIGQAIRDGLSGVTCVMKGSGLLNTACWVGYG